MEPCPSCDKQIASNAKTCPHCGHERKVAPYGSLCLLSGLITLAMLNHIFNELDKSGLSVLFDLGAIPFLAFTCASAYWCYRLFIEWRKRN